MGTDYQVISQGLYWAESLALSEERDVPVTVQPGEEMAVGEN